MKIPYPERIRLDYWLPFTGLLFAVELIQGTTFDVACLCFVILNGWALAFNVAGGLYTPSGAYIFFMIASPLISGLLAKVVLNEPVQSHLIEPAVTLSAYATGVFALLGAALVTRKFRRRTGVVANVLVSNEVTAISFGCLMLAAIPELVIPDQYLGTFSQLNAFGYLSIVLPVYYKAKETDGQKSFAWVAFIAIVYFELHGVVTFSKQAIFGPLVAWAIAAIAAGYRASFVKLITVGVLVTIFASLMTPFSQLARDDGADLPLSGRIDVTLAYLSHPLEVRDQYLEMSRYRLADDSNYHWFNDSQGLLDRLAMVPVDDALVYYTDQDKKAQVPTVADYFLNLVPRYIWPQKPYLNPGNAYAHMLGVLSPDDFTTGVSFGAFSDAYYRGKFLGTTLLIFGIFSFVFVVSDSVAGSVRQSVWPLIYVAFAAHSAPEGLLLSPIYMAGYTSVQVIFAAYFSTKFAPPIGALFTVQKRQALKRIT